MPFTVDYEIPLQFYLLKLDGYSPVFMTGNYVLIERFTGKTYLYKAVNPQTREIISLFYSKTQLPKGKHRAAAEKIMSASTDGTKTDRLKAAFKTGLELLTGKISIIFAYILTKYGYRLREKQAELSAQMLTALNGNKILISEAAVGIGKTHAYLIAAVLHKQDGKNDFWIRCGYQLSRDFYPDTPMPVVISTSSIALQQAVTHDYIPEISRILAENGFIKRPLSGVIRKGKEHYICDVRLKDYIPHAEAKAKAVLVGLLNENAALDLGSMDSLSSYIKRKICVTDNCNPQCPAREDCRYLSFLKTAQTGHYDFQVCNHQYLLADLVRRERGQKPLIPNYKSVIIDEAHRLEQAAQTIYGTEISNREIPTLLRRIGALTFADKKLMRNLTVYSDRLMSLNNQLFIALSGSLPVSGIFDDDTERFPARITDSVKTIIQSLRGSLEALWERLDGNDTNAPDPGIANRQENLFSYSLYALQNLSERLRIFQSPSEIVYWLEMPKLTRKVTGEMSLRCIPKRIGKFLYRDLWSKRFPVILTSGTLSTGGAFEHIKKRIGLDLISKEKITEVIKPSPFNYKKNCLLYISETVPFPDNQSPEYIKAAAGEIERLIQATHGHAAVLFTSYRVMELVYQIIKKRKTGFPLFKLNRSGGNAIARFRRSGNGVLFASGSMWEGIDLPGDILSLLVIVKLPFQVPDPLSEYEQSLYSDEDVYKRLVVLPDMLLKLKQGAGRLLRLESDTGVLAILDIRARIGGLYRTDILKALPFCRVTDSMKRVERFIQLVKNDEYFNGG